jgi:hypothetical protein
MRTGCHARDNAGVVSLCEVFGECPSLHRA